MNNYKVYPGADLKIQLMDDDSIHIQLNSSEKVNDQVMLRFDPYQSNTTIWEALHHFFYQFNEKYELETMRQKPKVLLSLSNDEIENWLYEIKGTIYYMAHQWGTRIFNELLEKLDKASEDRNEYHIITIPTYTGTGVFYKQPLDIKTYFSGDNYCLEVANTKTGSKRIWHFPKDLSDTYYVYYDNVSNTTEYRLLGPRVETEVMENMEHKKANLSSNDKNLIKETFAVVEEKGFLLPYALEGSFNHYEYDSSQERKKFNYLFDEKNGLKLCICLEYHYYIDNDPAGSLFVNIAEGCATLETIPKGGDKSIPYEEYNPTPEIEEKLKKLVGILEKYDIDTSLLPEQIRPKKLTI